MSEREEVILTDNRYAYLSGTNNPPNGLLNRTMLEDNDGTGVGTSWHSCAPVVLYESEDFASITSCQAISILTNALRPKFI